MRKENPVRYSSAVGEAWMHFSFKAKYCHNIFDMFGVRNATNALLIKACRRYNIPYKSIGLLAIGIICLFPVKVKGLSLVPRPPASIRPFISITRVYESNSFINFLIA